MRLKSLLNTIAVILLVAFRTNSFAQTDALEQHIWFNEEKSAKIQIYNTNGKFFGKVIWLREPNREGKPKTDIHNPDKSKRNDPILGLLILRNFVKGEDGLYQDGTIYDPKNGKTYSCKMTLKGNKLEVRGYVGISLLGRSTTWTPAD